MKKSEVVPEYGGSHTTSLECPEDHQDMLDMFRVSREFKMKYRGLLYYYGKDFVAFKKENRDSQGRNLFLEVIASYMTLHLEDECPDSWNECPYPFWEELIFTYLPSKTKILPEKNFTHLFLHELHAFLTWLDEREHTALSPKVLPFIKESLPMLSRYESLFADLFLRNYPKMHQPDWNYRADMAIADQKWNLYAERAQGLFQVHSIEKEGILFIDLLTRFPYFIRNVPVHRIDEGMVIAGAIGRRESGMVWDLVFPDGFFPKRGIKYIGEDLVY
ncbi:hypothetical protein [Rossellomorea marisflavi]|uniref:hypothetical protein n=1 Tax=Rossellomorea marisflavi TaxID=189381 RepID=UPI00204080B9|nr:hypothetical protein [Rossellomorea marisflavi]MCM2591948.1 hypothetical protein [Rossellomorea marisflavi]